MALSDLTLTRTPISTTTRAGLLLVALGALILLVACSGGDPERLGDRVCREEHLPEGFERLTFGNISRQDLGREVGAEALAQAGIEGGHFAFWKERLDELRGDLASEIVCQVIAFGEEEAAARFVADLPVDRDWLSVTVAGIALAEGASLGEVEAAGVRAFRIVEGEGRLRYAVVAARGRFVLSVHLGGPEGSVSAGEAVAILEAMTR